MANITIRNLDSEVKTQIRIRAAGHGRSMEEEARTILRAAVEREEGPKNLAQSIRARFARINEEIDRKKISRKYLARQLETSDNQIQRLFDPRLTNKNLPQLYKLAALLGLEFEMSVKAA